MAPHEQQCVNFGIISCGRACKTPLCNPKKSIGGYAQLNKKPAQAFTMMKNHRYNGRMINKETLEADLKEAMRSKDDVRKRSLRMVLSAIKLVEIERQDDLDEETILGIIQREVKTRQETIEEAKQAGRDDLIASTLAEIEVLQVYLPQPLGEDELREIVQRAIEEVGASDPQDMGKVMKVLMPQIQGRADGKIASDLVRELLAPPQKD